MTCRPEAAKRLRGSCPGRRSRRIYRTTLALVVSSLVFAGAAAARIVGTVGPSSTISLKTGRGVRITHLGPGRRTFRIRDRSAFHNFHLAGPGGVNRKTGVPFTGRRRWTVKLVAGKYNFWCDRHPQTMRGSFRVP